MQRVKVALIERAPFGHSRPERSKPSFALVRFVPLVTGAMSAEVVSVV